MVRDLEGIVSVLRFTKLFNHCCFSLFLWQGAMSAFGDDDSDSDEEEVAGMAGKKQAGGRAGVNYMMMKEAQKNKSAKKVCLPHSCYTFHIQLSIPLGHLGQQHGAHAAGRKVRHECENT